MTEWKMTDGGYVNDAGEFMSFEDAEKQEAKFIEAEITDSPDVLG